MKVGLIGCGHIANGHMLVYDRIENAQVVAVADIDLQKANLCAERYGVSKVFSDYKDLLQIKDLDLVDICTPVSTHAHIACDAASFGRNVLVEKPMALTSSECEAMINESEKHQTKICVCHNQLFLPSIMKAKAIVESADTDLVSFTTTVKESFEVLKARDLARSWNVTSKERGVIWEVGCHPAYLQLHFLENVKEVYAVGNRVRYPVYDDFSVLLWTAGRSYGLITVSWVSREQEIVYEIRTSDERRLWINYEFDYLLEKSEKPPWSIVDAMHSFYLDEKRTIGKWFRYGLNYIRKRKTVSHYNLIRRYLESIEEDASPPVSPLEGMNAIRLLECIEESLNKHKVVHMNVH